MVAFDSFNVVVVGTFQPPPLDLADFDFHGQHPAEILHVPPVLQAAVAEYTLDLLPGRFIVTAKASKATEHRVEPMKEAVRTFGRDYVGPRAISFVGYNFVGSVRPRGRSAQDLVASFVKEEPLISAAGSDPVRYSLLTFWMKPDLGQLQLKLEPSNDGSVVTFEVNIHIGSEYDSSSGQPMPRLPISIDDALSRFEPARAAADDLLTNLLEKR